MDFRTWHSTDPADGHRGRLWQGRDSRPLLAVSRSEFYPASNKDYELGPGSIIQPGNFGRQPQANQTGQRRGNQDHHGNRSRHRHRNPMGRPDRNGNCQNGRYSAERHANQRCQVTIHGTEACPRRQEARDPIPDGEGQERARPQPRGSGLCGQQGSAAACSVQSPSQQECKN